MHEAQLRDELAVERTRLANERTLLAYVRTALASAAGGAALLEFFPAHSILTGLAWLLVVAGAGMFVVGLIRFYKVRDRLGVE